MENSVSASVNRTLGLCIGAIAIFALNLFVLQKWMMDHDLGHAGFFVYIGIRIVGFVALGYLLVRFARRSRFQAMSTVMIVGAIDQVALKFFSTRAMMQADPVFLSPEGMPSDVTIFYGLATGFLFFAPILLILGFLGVELNRLGRDWKRNAT